MQTNTPHLPAGTVLGGRYRIERFISAGGFGCTYEGVHIDLGARVAIKEFFVKDFCDRDKQTNRIHSTQAKQKLVEKLKSKFRGEAHAVFSLQHENIVRVTDLFEENDTAYFVMDYIEGRSLSNLLHQRGPLPESEALGYIRQVAAALDYVHTRGRYHLDVKPGNIMVDTAGRAILIDFGASKQYESEGGENTSTITPYTPGYAPVEQSKPGSVKFTPATDIYALGATLYKILTDVTPPHSVDLMSEDETLAPLPSHITPTTRRAVYAAMQLKRKDRTQSIADFLSLLDEGKCRNKEDRQGEGETTEADDEKIITVDPEPTKFESTHPVLPPAPKSGRWKWFLGFIIVLVVLAAGYYYQKTAGDSASDATGSVSVYNGHDYVDLGLPSGLKWATCNVGADSPEDDGYYYAWGETLSKREYTEENSATYSMSVYELESEGTITSSGHLAHQYDAASANWGGSWRMPTRDEVKELIQNCTTTWATLNGVRGHKVTSKTNGNSIFFPAVGSRRGDSLDCYGTYGGYWSSTPSSSSSSYACRLYFNSGHFLWDNSGSRYYGRTVRAVSD